MTSTRVRGRKAPGRSEGFPSWQNAHAEVDPTCGRYSATTGCGPRGRTREVRRVQAVNPCHGCRWHRPVPQRFSSEWAQPAAYNPSTTEDVPVGGREAHLRSGAQQGCAGYREARLLACRQARASDVPRDCRLHDSCPPAEETGAGNGAGLDSAPSSASRLGAGSGLIDIDSDWRISPRGHGPWVPRRA